jgi:hypothetical protein
MPTFISSCAEAERRMLSRAEPQATVFDIGVT